MNLVSIHIFALFTCIVSKKFEVETYKGVIEGNSVRDSEYGRYKTFFGIPYAMVNLRDPFGASVETSPYSSEFKANNSKIICPQMNKDKTEVIGEIQCLRLNIYSPAGAYAESPAPVLLWFRGHESDTEFEGKYLVKHDIVVVIANYRLGPYGFLCVNDPAVPGNQGLKDQYAALRWVSQNILNFGGDRDKITIAGQGAVELHLYSKKLKLFNQVIIHSGSAFSEAMYGKGDQDAAIKLAKHLGHNATSTREALDILAEINAKEVVQASYDLKLKLGACRENKQRNVSNFVVKDALHLGDDINNQLSTTKIMIGYTSNELSEVFSNKDDKYYESIQDIFGQKLNESYKLSHRQLLDLIKVVKAFYLGNRKIDKNATSELSNFLSDFTMNHPIEVSVSNFIVKGAPAVYKWLFSYTDNVTMEINAIGASNSAELKYLFGFRNRNMNREEKVVMENMTKMWANFVKYGNPTFSSLSSRNKRLLPYNWTSITDDLDGRPYMNIGSTLKMGHQIYHDRIAFWDLFFLNYSRKKYSVLDNH